MSESKNLKFVIVTISDIEEYKKVRAEEYVEKLKEFEAQYKKETKDWIEKKKEESGKLIEYKIARDAILCKNPENFEPSHLCRAICFDKMKETFEKCFSGSMSVFEPWEVVTHECIFETIKQFKKSSVDDKFVQEFKMLDYKKDDTLKKYILDQVAYSENFICKAFRDGQDCFVVLDFDPEYDSGSKYKDIMYMVFNPPSFTVVGLNHGEPEIISDEFHYTANRRDVKNTYTSRGDVEELFSDFVSAYSRFTKNKFNH